MREKTKGPLHTSSKIRESRSSCIVVRSSTGLYPFEVALRERISSSVGQTTCLYFVVHTRGQHLQIGEGFHECQVRFYCCFYLIVWLVRNNPVRDGKFHFAPKNKNKNYARFHSEKLWIGSVFRLVFHVALLQFFFSRHMLTLLCDCGVITSRLIRDWSSKRNCHYETMLEVNICYSRASQYVHVLKLFPLKK